MPGWIRFAAALALTAALGVPAWVQAADARPGADPAPHLEMRGKAWQLIVDGKPYFARAGELNNSSSSSSAFMADIWPKLVRANVNTVLAPITWEVIEPEEGKFDFSTVDQLLAQAREHGIRVVPLWLATWKNGSSNYTPYWVKTDQKRFPLVRTSSGAIDTVSALSQAARNADAKAFAALMRHIREVDSTKRTVIMVQVENEVGVLGDVRDRSAAADAAFAAPVPARLTSYLSSHAASLVPETVEAWKGAGGKTAGNWVEVFGPTHAEEYFEAWSYADFVNHVAAAGKAEYDVPMFVNAWLPSTRNTGAPGSYPSGGPVPRSQDIWRAAGPGIDMMTPDVYVPTFPEILANYNRAGNPVFVAEGRPELEGAANAAYLLGKGGFGYSPFGIESRIADYDKGPITRVYDLIKDLEPVVFDHQAAGTIDAAIVDKDHPEQRLRMGDYTVIVGLVQDRNTPAYLADKGYGIIMMTGKDQFMVAGYGVQVTFASATPSGDVVGLGPVDEGWFRGGQWVPGRRLNGDEVVLYRDYQKRTLENQAGTGLRFLKDGPEIQKVRLYRYAR